MAARIVGTRAGWTWEISRSVGTLAAVANPLAGRWEARLVAVEPGLHHQRCGPLKGADTRAMAFLIHDGRIHRAPSDFARYVGLPVDRVLDELRAIARPVR